MPMAIIDAIIIAPHAVMDDSTSIKNKNGCLRENIILFCSTYKIFVPNYSADII